VWRDKKLFPKLWDYPGVAKYVPGGIVGIYE
jgi:hypothetical protein